MTASDCFSFQLYSCWFCCNTHQAVLFLLMSALSRIKAVWSQPRRLGILYFTLIGLHAMWLSVFASASVCLNNLSELIITRHMGVTKYKASKLSALRIFFVVCRVLTFTGGSSMTLSSYPDQGHVTLSWEEICTSAIWIRRKMLASISAWHQTLLAQSSAERPVCTLHVSPYYI